MTTAPSSPFVLVGDPAAAACEGDVCAVPETPEPVTAPEDQDRDLSPVEQAPAPRPLG